MKKTYRMFGTLCMMGVMAFFASSCNKNNEETAVSIGLPAFEEVSGDDLGEKLYVDFNDGNAYKWNAGDEVMIYNLDANDGNNTVSAIYTTGASAEGQTLAVFNGDDLGAKKDHYFVFFPVNKIDQNRPLGQNNYQYFLVPESQEYTLVNGNPNVPTVDRKGLAAACEINTITSRFTLHHIFGICRLKLKGDKTVTKIELIDPHHGLAGEVGMKLHEVNMAKFQDLMDKYTLATDQQSGMNPAFISAWNTYRQELGYTSQAGVGCTINPDGHTITLDIPSPGVTLNTTTVTPFYIVVRPGAFIDGFTIKVYYEGGSTTITKYQNPKNSYRIRAGYITSFTPDAI